MRMTSRPIIAVTAIGSGAIVVTAVLLLRAPRASDTSTAASVSFVAAKPTEPGRPVAVLEHDFGLVMCGTISFHEFDVRNDGDKPWTVKSMSSDCSCSVVEASRPVIPPGESGRFQFRYRAPTSPKNHVGDVRLEFVEESAPRVLFKVTATVRNPLTLSAGELRFEMARSGACEREVRVDNFSGRSWSHIEFVDLPNWLKVDGIRQIPVESPQTQSWLVKWRAREEVDETAEEFQSQFMWVRAVEDRSANRSQAPPEAQLRVTRVITKEYVLTPSSLQFGPMKPSESKQVSIILQKKTEPFEDVDLFSVGVVDAPPNVDLRISLSQRSPTVIVISGTCTATGAAGVLSGTAALSIPNGRTLGLPFSGRVVALEE